MRFYLNRHLEKVNFDKHHFIFFLANGDKNKIIFFENMIKITDKENKAVSLLKRSQSPMCFDGNTTVNSKHNNFMRKEMVTRSSVFTDYTNNNKSIITRFPSILPNELDIVNKIRSKSKVYSNILSRDQSLAEIQMHHNISNYHLSRDNKVNQSRSKGRYSCGMNK
jgi:hypothetical protein